MNTSNYYCSVKIASDNLAKELTDYNVVAKNLTENELIKLEYEENINLIQQILGQRGIKPEELPPAEDIKKLERRVKRQEKEISQKSKKFSHVED